MKKSWKQRWYHAFRTAAMLLTLFVIVRLAANWAIALDVGLAAGKATCTS